MWYTLSAPVHTNLGFVPGSHFLLIRSYYRISPFPLCMDQKMPPKFKIFCKSTLSCSINGPFVSPIALILHHFWYPYPLPYDSTGPSAKGQVHIFPTLGTRLDYVICCSQKNHVEVAVLTLNFKWSTMFLLALLHFCHHYEKDKLRQATECQEVERYRTQSVLAWVLLASPTSLRVPSQPTAT